MSEGSGRPGDLCFPRGGHASGPPAYRPPPPICSEDHRGTPEAPGRVVTLIERAHWASLADGHDAAPDQVWGVAYRIRPERVAEVRASLDLRESNGYTIDHTLFHAAAAAAASAPRRRPLRALVYIGTPDNRQFVGPQEPQALAEHIFRSAGPSGPNRDYLWALERALDQLGPDSRDAHVSDLAQRVRALAAREAAETGLSRAPPPLESLGPDGRGQALQTGDEREETQQRRVTHG